MGRQAMWLLAFALALVSCTDAATDTNQTTASPDPSVTSTSAATPATTTTIAPQVTAPGRLVILDESGNVVVLDPDGSNQKRLTDDAGTSAAYTQPIWSPDGDTLAWGQIQSEGFSVGIHSLSRTETTTVPTANLPFYMYFSSGGDRLGVLHNGSVGIDFNIVDVPSGSIQRVDFGQPFYFSWSPADDLLVTHVGPDRVETIDSDGARVPLEPTGPLYLAPQWTEAGIFHVDGEALVIEDENENRNVVALVPGLTMFVANTQGTAVALQSAGQGGAVDVALADPPRVSPNRVVLVDLATGDVESVTDGPAIGFFWSPDGRKLLALQANESEVTPLVRDEDGSITRYPGYLPPGTMLQDTFPFFPQYAQSVSFWAPDSFSFAYAGEVEGDRGIWIQSLDADAPVKVAEGRWVAWSGS